MIFIPTYLYVKQHTITGLKYFGKTTKNPLKYPGSGTHWKRHIKKHGKQHVVTVWYQLFHSVEDIVAYATKFSNENNIVESHDWANCAPENGLDGSLRHNSGTWFKTYNSVPRTETHCSKISKSLKGKSRPYKAKRIKIDNVIFESMLSAASYYNVTYMTIYNWTRRNKAIIL